MSAPALTAAQRADVARWQRQIAATVRQITKPVADAGAWLEKYGRASERLDWAEAEAWDASEQDILRTELVVAPQDEPVADATAKILQRRLKTGPPKRKAAPLARRGASETLLGSSEKSSRKPVKNQETLQSLYSGQTLRGFIRGREGFDVRGESLGTFPTRSAAVGSRLESFDNKAQRDVSGGPVLSLPRFVKSFPDFWRNPDGEIRFDVFRFGSRRRLFHCTLLHCMAL